MANPQHSVARVKMLITIEDIEDCKVSK